jgi:integrase
MSAEHSTTDPVLSKDARPGKPAKPYPEFPLTPHPAGVWCKKIRGKLHYFGKWDDPDGALKEYLEQKDALHAGRKPRAVTDGITVKEMCNQFLNAKAASRDAGELTPRSWHDYRTACELLVSHFSKGRRVDDLAPDDFAELRAKMAKDWGPSTLGNVIQRMRVAFKFAFDNGLIDRPVRYGQGFKRPTRKVLRIHKAKQGRKLFTGEEIRRLIEGAGISLKAMILLGINAGFGNADCGNLPLTALDLDNAILDYPRPKTGIARRCLLWPETVEAIRASLVIRPDPKDPEDAGLVFVTKYGKPWAKDIADSPITKETAKLLKVLGINGRKGLGFYTLRHTFRTVADEAKDQPAADYIMGHEVPHMSSIYRETISDERLRAVVNHVRDWLLSPATKGEASQQAGPANPDPERI